MAFIIDYEKILRPSVFILLLLFLLIGEHFHPLAQRKSPRLWQWSVNLALSFINTVTLHLMLPVLAVGVAYFASEQKFGILHWLEVPELVAIAISLLLLDLLIYWQHRLFHKIPMLWRLHRMHHTEIGLDATSAVRFHPIEIVLSMLIKMVAVLLLGVPVVAVIMFELLLSSLALFNHSNVKLPSTVDRWLRIFLVTPEVHWIHHSPLVRETDSNYGFNLIIWDKLFNSYIDKPCIDYAYMQQGLNEFGVKKSLNLLQLLLVPFKRQR